MKPTTCPKCRRMHAGPRTVDELRIELGRVLAAATFLDDDAKAAERLRSQCHGIALELMNLCPSCKFDEMLIPVVQRYEAAIGDIERRMQSVSEHQVGQLLPRQRPSLVVGSSFSVTKEEPLC